MANVQHNTLDGVEVHTPFRWDVADDAARLALVVSVSDIKKLCYVQATTGVWILTGVSPATWKQVDLGAVSTGTVKVTAADTGLDFLGAKVAAGGGITLNVLNPGGNEQLEISASIGAIDHNALLNTHNLTTDIDHDTITNAHNLTTDIDHDTLTNAHNLTTDIDHNAITNTHNLTTDIDHDTITNNHNLTTDIDHDTITNTHNLTTDIDHDALTNFVLAEHIDWSINGPETLHDNRVPASCVTQHEGVIDHNALTNTHNLTTDIDHDTITNAHNLTTDIDHDALTNFVAAEHINWTVPGIEVLDDSRVPASNVLQHEASIDHDNLTNTHNLTTDINHNTLLNYLAAEHINWNINGAETIHDGRVPASNVTQHEGSIDHNNLQNTHDLTTDIDHDTITNNHNLTTDIDHDTLTNYLASEHVDWAANGAETLHDNRVVASNITQHEASIDHDNLLNSHNLTTDIDHDGLLNFVANEHIDWSISGPQTLHNARVTLANVTQHEANIDHDGLANTHNLTTDIDHNTILNNHNLTTDINHDTILNNHNLTTDIDHDAINNYVAAEHIAWAVIGAETLHNSRVTAGNVTQHVGSIDHDLLLNTHNLTTDIDHDALTNYVANEHIDWTVTGAADIHDDRIGSTSVTQHVALINHNSLLNTHNLTTDIDHTTISNIGTNSHATIDTHLASTTNPHSVTAAQVGNTTAQWNANQLQGRDVQNVAPNNLDELVWSTGNTRWEPRAARMGWMLHGGVDGVGANNTTPISMGTNAANNGVPMIRAGRIVGISISINTPCTSGTLDGQVLLNGVAQTGAGETVQIESVTNTTDNYQIIPTPITYAAGDVIYAQTVTVGFAPNGADATVCVFCEDT